MKERKAIMTWTRPRGESGCSNNEHITVHRWMCENVAYWHATCVDCGEIVVSKRSLELVEKEMERLGLSYVVAETGPVE